MGVIKVVVAEDYGPIRNAISALLDKEADILVVGEACDGAEAVQQVPVLLPDVLVLDMEMPVLGGLDVIQRIQVEQVPVNILVLSAYDDGEYISGAFALGASGFVSKDEGPDKILQAVRQVARGETVYYGSQRVRHLLL